MERPSSGSARIRIGATEGLGEHDSIPLPRELGGMLADWAAGPQLLLQSHQFKAYKVPADGAARVPVPVSDTTQFMAHMQVSPDGRWLASISGIFPNIEVYVQNLEGPAARRQVSAGGGLQPHWTRGGREIVYESFADGWLRTVDVDLRAGFHLGTPQKLFKLPLGSFGAAETSWEVDASGERFYVIVSPSQRDESFVEVASGFEQMVNRK
jgi:hypothetical protein